MSMEISVVQRVLALQKDVPYEQAEEVYSVQPIIPLAGPSTHFQIVLIKSHNESMSAAKIEVKVNQIWSFIGNKHSHNQHIDYTHMKVLGMDRVTATMQRKDGKQTHQELKDMSENRLNWQLVQDVPAEVVKTVPLNKPENSQVSLVKTREILPGGPVFSMGKFEVPFTEEEQGEINVIPQDPKSRHEYWETMAFEMEKKGHFEAAKKYSLHARTLLAADDRYDAEKKAIEGKNYILISDLYKMSEADRKSWQMKGLHFFMQMITEKHTFYMWWTPPQEK